MLNGPDCVTDVSLLRVLLETINYCFFLTQQLF